MTKTEEQTIRNIIARLREQNLGCGHGPGTAPRVAALQGEKFSEGGFRLEVASRLFVDTWLIGPLECLIGDENGAGRDPRLGLSMSKK